MQEIFVLFFRLYAESGLYQLYFYNFVEILIE